MNTISQNLILLGVPRTVSKVIECLSDGKARTMHEIEKELDLRQPEVCLAVELLSGYILVGIKKGMYKGRPQKTVEMTRDDYLRYIDVIRLEKLEEYDIMKKAIEELKQT